MAKEKFVEIDVERLNIVSKDGKMRLSISNEERMPDPVIGGKTAKRGGSVGSGSPGFIFFNQKGDECGGLAWNGNESEDGHQAFAGLMFDQFRHQEVLTFSYGQTNGQHHAGMSVIDNPPKPLSESMDRIQEIQAMPEGSEKRAALMELQPEVAGAQRVFLGRLRDGQAAMTLGDSKGRARLKLRVDEDDHPTIELLGPASTTMSESVDRAKEIAAMPPGEEQSAAARQFERDLEGKPRLTAGQTQDGETALTLNDSQGKPRLKIYVDDDDNPKIDMLDGNGEVIFSLPPAH